VIKSSTKIRKFGNLNLNNDRARRNTPKRICGHFRHETLGRDPRLTAARIHSRSKQIMRWEHRLSGSVQAAKRSKRRTKEGENVFLQPLAAHVNRHSWKGMLYWARKSSCTTSLHLITTPAHEFRRVAPSNAEAFIIQEAAKRA
jgi:hypothetical protein